MQRNWGTTSNTHYRGKFFQRNVKTYLIDGGNFIIFPFRLIYLFFQELYSISWGRLFVGSFKGAVLIIGSIVIFYGAYMAVKVINYLGDRAAIQQAQVQVEIDKQVQLQMDQYKEKIAPVLHRSDIAYEDLQYYKAHSQPVFYKHKKPYKAIIMNGPNKGKKKWVDPNRAETE